MCDVEQDYDNQMYVRISKVEFEVNLEKFKEKNGSNFPLSDFFLCVPKSIFFIGTLKGAFENCSKFSLYGTEPFWLLVLVLSWKGKYNSSAKCAPFVRYNHVSHISFN